MKKMFAKVICMVCLCLVLFGVTMKLGDNEDYNQIAGPFVSEAGNYIYDVVEEMKNHVR